ncbi:DUF3224 domain-containing protein [soil metagenome]|jgi:hypothetical protein
MSTRATGTFDIETWDEKPYEEQEGARLTRTHVSKTFHGEGKSTAELLMAYAAVEGPAAYVGFERIVGHVHGRPGSFVLHHTATGARGTRSASWSVVPDSGTGEPRGLRGDARISVEPDGGHSFTLDYDFERQPDEG